jgi:hypothetical protein
VIDKPCYAGICGSGTVVYVLGMSGRVSCADDDVEVDGAAFDSSQGKVDRPYVFPAARIHSSECGETPVQV